MPRPIGESHIVQMSDGTQMQGSGTNSFREGTTMNENRGDSTAHGLVCICGNPHIHKRNVAVDGAEAHELHCSSCGIFMRAPKIDGQDNAGWLYKHWRSILMRRDGERQQSSWVLRSADGSDHICKKCGGEAPYNGIEEEVLTRYCPHCGRLMVKSRKRGLRYDSEEIDP